MKITFKRDAKKKVRPPFFEKIAYFIEWGEWVVVFIKWILTSLRTFPPIPVFVQEPKIEDEKKDNNGSD